MELQEILGCLGNVEKLNTLPLSTLKAAAEKYPYISQLKELLLKKETSPQGIKDYLLSSTDHTPSTELNPNLDLTDSDPSLLIRIVKKDKTTPKQTGKTVLNLKKDKINPLESKLTLVKPDTKEELSLAPQKAVNQVASALPKKNIRKVPVPAAKKTSIARPTRNTPAKRTYVRKSTAAKTIQVSPINPPLPDWKEILSKIEIKISSSTRPTIKNKATNISKRSDRVKATVAKTKAVKTIRLVKKNSTKTASASSQNIKTKAKKKEPKKTNSNSKKKISTENKAPISSKKERLKFSEWLSEKSKKTKPKTKKKFSKTKSKTSLKRLVKSSLVKKEEIATLTLAKLYSKQGHYKKAIKVYERLRLLNPEKSSFFASKIRKLKQK